MADYISVVQGSAPWQPAPDAALEKVIQRYTIPLCGIVSQHNVKYLFWCFFGQASEYNVWAYTLLTDDEVGRLCAAQGPDVVEVLRDVTARRGCVVAFAGEDVGIIISENYEPGLLYGDRGQAGAALHLLAEHITAARSGLEAMTGT